MLGDPCQICNCVNGRSILGCVDNVIEWKGVEGKRRQSGEFVEFLDSMRGLGVCEQREKAIKYFDYGRKEDCSVVIGGTWSQLGNVNAWFLDRNEEIPVRVIKGSSTVRKIIKKASVEKDQVFHIRRTFAEAKQPIEVAFASTVDSYQGSTLEGKVGILVADLSRPGALYTALTRVKDRCQIVLLG